MTWNLTKHHWISYTQINNMDREKVITNMCYTFRHDYGLTKPEGNVFSSQLSSGMTQDEREALWKQMAQIFDNDIAPYMEFKK